VSRRFATILVSLALLGLGSLTPAVGAQQPAPARQVTMFGILATPGGSEIDPKLKKIEVQLRKLFPGKEYSFKLLATESKRLEVGQSFVCNLGDGFVAGTELRSTLDGEGNLQMRFVLDLHEQTEFTTIVRTPPNQLFFCDKQLPNGAKLLIGLGGR
jgi:hypothetical protein